MDGRDPAVGPTVEVLATEDLGARAAAVVARALRAAVAERGRATLAVSGGSTPGPMFDALVAADVPWSHVHVLQVDERVAPDGDPDRNLVDLRERLLDHVGVPEEHVHPVPAGSGDADAAAADYATVLVDVAGDPPVLDVVHLGLGSDGHTASLVPGDAAVDVRDGAATATGVYQGRRRVTTTVPTLRAARQQVWLVGGADKRGAVTSLLTGDVGIPASAVLVDDAVVLLDRSAAGEG